VVWSTKADHGCTWRYQPPRYKTIQAHPFLASKSLICMLSRFFPHMVIAAAASEHKVAPALKDVLSRAATASKQANLKKPVRCMRILRIPINSHSIYIQSTCGACSLALLLSARPSLKSLFKKHMMLARGILERTMCRLICGTCNHSNNHACV